MLKLIFRVVRWTAILGLLVAVPKIISIQRSALDFVNVIAAQGKGATSLLGGQAPSLQGASPTASVSKLMQLMSGQSAGTSSASGDSAASDAETVPAGPTTVIYHPQPDAKRGKSGDTAVMELPPDASAIFVDGRLQIYYRSEKPRKAR
jgi:hypothetical protein